MSDDYGERVEPTSDEPGEERRSAASIQHALNNPLTVVLANIDFALESVSLGDVHRDALLQAREAANELRYEIRALGALQPASVRPPRSPSPAHEGAPIPRVLLIDDNEMVLRALKRTLRDHDVAVTSEPMTALDLLRSGDTFDAILCDVKMPTMSGVEFYRALKLVSPEQSTRVMFLTGGVTSDSDVRTIDGSGVTVVRKPVDAEALKALIQARR